MKNVKYYCRICEKKIFYKSFDGLCAMCHISICQESPNKCIRCQNVTNGLVEWLKIMEEDNGN